MPLRAFESDALAREFVKRQGAIVGEASRRRFRSLACNGPAERQPNPAACRYVIGAPGWFDDSSLLVHHSQRHLVQLDSALQPLQTGSNMARSGDDLYVVRRGELLRVRTGEGGLQVTARERTRIDDHRLDHLWDAEWNDEVVTWGNLVVTLDHGVAAVAVLRTFEALPDGSLQPRGTLVLSGQPPQTLSHTAMRRIGSRLVLYSSWSIRSDAGEYETPEYLTPLVPSTEEGEPIFPEDTSTFPFERVFRPVGVLDSSVRLDHVHALLTCDLAIAPLTCVPTMVLAPGIEHYYNTDTDITIVTRGDAGRMTVRLPYSGAAPTAVLHGAAMPDVPAHLATVAVRSDSARNRRLDLTAGEYVAHVVTPAANRSDARDMPYPDTIMVRHIASSRRVSVAVPHRVHHAVHVGSGLLLVGPRGDTMGASLLELSESPRIAQSLVLPSASAEPGNAVLTVHQEVAEGRVRYRAGFSVRTPITDSTRDRFEANNALWLFEIVDGRMAALGMLRAAVETFRRFTDHFSIRDRLGETRAVIDGDRVFVLFGSELVEATLSGGGVREVRRQRMFPLSAPDPLD